MRLRLNVPRRPPEEILLAQNSKPGGRAVVNPEPAIAH